MTKISKVLDDMITRFHMFMLAKCPDTLYRILYNYMNPRAYYKWLKRKIQYLKRGFDDSETWNLDTSFYKWLYPRLKRFMVLTNGFPDKYKSFEDWKKELDKRLKQLYDIINIDEYDYEDYSYIDNKVLEEYKKANRNKLYINQVAYCRMEEDFNKWFGENINYLWW